MNSGETVHRLGTIIQSIFCAQSGASIRLTVWKWSGESRYPGAFPPVLENFRRAFSPGPTDRPWVSEDASTSVIYQTDGFGNFRNNLIVYFLFSWYCPEVRLLVKVSTSNKVVNKGKLKILISNV